MKKSIVDIYGKLARANKGNLISKLFGCCSNEELVNQVAGKIGYSDEEVHAVPTGANLGVGCGNPSAHAHIQEGQTVVDLGSGAGFDAFLVSRMVGNSGKVLGIDLSDDMLALARKNSKKGGYQNVEFIKGDIEMLPLQDAVADYVISNCVINLSQRKDRVYQEAYRVLRPGGSLSISDIVLLKELPAEIKNALAGHIACVSGAEPLEVYLQYVRDAGFKNVQIESKRSFPLELIFADPQVRQLARQLDFDLESNEARDLAARVCSISLTAKK